MKKMKNKQITFCAIMAALAAVIMMGGWFPYFTYTIPCVASLTTMVVTIEYDKKSAFLTYLVSLLPIMLFCEIESKILYLCFAGFYPPLKALVERMHSRVIEFVVKFVCFNICVGLVYVFSTFVFGVTFDDVGELGKYGAVILLVLANITFIAYDFCITKMAEFYILKFYSKISKIFKK